MTESPDIKAREERYLRFEVWPGNRIEDVATSAARLAKEKNMEVRAEFNGTDLVSLPGSTPEAVMNVWWNRRPAPKDQRGVWMVWNYGDSAWPFATEVEALRFGLEKDMKVSFVKWGDYAG